jgi:hypothetical protein
MRERFWAVVLWGGGVETLSVFPDPASAFEWVQGGAR